MQDKRSVKCSFCDHTVNTTHSAVICSECEAKLLTQYCPGCGQPVVSGSTTKEHSRIWHTACSTIFEIDNIDEDNKEDETTIKSTPKIARKILTGNSTYLFYDKDRKLKGSSRYMQRLESISSNRRNSMEMQLQNPVDVANNDEDDFDYLSPLSKSSEGDALLSRYRQIVYRLQSFDFIKERTVDGKIYQDSITGHEFVSFLLHRKLCENIIKAKEIGQDFMDYQILIPYSLNDENDETDNQHQENSVFEGEGELYYVDITIFETTEAEEKLESVVPMKEHNNIIRMTGCLTTMNKDGKSQTLWYELTAGILRSYEMKSGKKKEDSDLRCIEALDTQEFTVVPILKANKLTDCFKLVGTVREITYQAESCEMCEEWISVLRVRD